MSRGSTWAKWDLHIHTPASYEWRGSKRLRDAVSSEERDAILKEVVESINASGCAAVAVMDYWTFDGVKALREYVARPDTPKLVPTVFPGIELRMVSPGNFRLNMHVLLNPRLTSEQLDLFKAQLRLAIPNMPLSDTYLIELGRQHVPAERLQELGTTREVVLKDDWKALEAGSKVAEVTPTSVIEALKLFGERDVILFVPFDTNDGVKAINFRKHHGFPRELLGMEAIFEVSDLNTRDAFVGIKTAANSKYFDSFAEATKHPKLAVRGSDAHRPADYGNFPGGKTTWLKATPTFEGLLQACKEPANRSFIGATPPKLEFIANHPQLFIDSVKIRKVPGAPEVGTWFDGVDLSLNSDLVALIGRKGNGKSALADVLGLLGDTPNERYFSFLSDQRFRLQKDNKAASFEGLLTWNADTKEPAWRQLSSLRDAAAVQRIKYLPQRYFEELCNDHVRGDDRLLQSELQAVIFSHISAEERQGAESLADLIETRTAGVERDIQAFRTALKDINGRIISLSVTVSESSRLKLREAVRLSIVQLRALKANRPKVPPPPTAEDDATRALGANLAALNESLEKLERDKREAEAAVESLKARIRLIDEVDERLGSLVRHVEAEQAALSASLAALGLEWGSLVAFKFEPASLRALRKSAHEGLELKRQSLDPSLAHSLNVRIAATRTKLSEEQAKLNEPMRLYQEALAAEKRWQEDWNRAVGSPDVPESFRGLWSRLRLLPKQRVELASLMDRRAGLSVSILAALQKRASVLKELFSPVQALVDEEPDIREALGVQFSVRFSFDAFSTRVFDFIKQSAGSFVGLEESKALAQSLIDAHDLTSEVGLRAFLAAVDHALNNDVRSSSSRSVNVSSLLRTDRTLQELYDFVYGLSYVEMSYGLMLGSVELERLSPGQRGALLLIFYLLVDRDRIPIVLDQPEENLDNETVYNLLVGVINRAKQHRQVIMVTHNANLAVACDAEQVIVCSMERDHGANRISYKSGSIEELELNRAVVDILEGTKPAFENRRRKYA